MKNLFKGLSLALVAVFALTACSGGQGAQVGTEEGKVDLYRGYGSPHGERSFSSLGVALSGDKIVAVSIDEYQTGDSNFSPVPNSDGSFGKGFKEGNLLFSKLENSDKYSAMMAEKAGSTVSYKDNLKAIQDFAVGKTKDELRAALDKAEAGKAMDAVSGATLVDTKGYLENILEVMENPVSLSSGQVENVEDLSIKRALSAPHGDRGFAEIYVLEEKGKVLVASMDEFQFMGGQGVPNSEGAFGQAYADPASPLASKLVNAQAYSKMMAEKAKSTISIDKNFKAIEDFAKGKTKADLEEALKGAEAGKPMDAVSGATLVDTSSYLKAIADML